MTPNRPVAALLVRALVVVGGGFALLVLGAGVAGAADISTSTVTPDRVGPAPVSVPLPAPATPHLALRPIAIRAPGFQVAAGDAGASVRIDPGSTTVIPGLVVPPVLPDLPALPDLSRLPVGAASRSVSGVPVPPAPGTPTPRPAPLARGSKAVTASPATPRTGAPEQQPEPSPEQPRPVPAPAAPLLDLAALALGMQLSSRRGAAEQHTTPPTARGVRALLHAGAAASARVVTPRPGFGLLLTRPG